MRALVGGGEVAQPVSDFVAQLGGGELAKAHGGGPWLGVQLQHGVFDLPAPAGERIAPRQQRVFLRAHGGVGLDVARLPPVERALRQAVGARQFRGQRFAAQQPVDQPVALGGLRGGGEDAVDVPGVGRQRQHGAQGVRRAGVGQATAERDGRRPLARRCRPAVGRRRAPGVAARGAQPVGQLRHGDRLEPQAMRGEQRGQLFAVRRAIDEAQARPVLQGSEQPAARRALQRMFEPPAQAGAVGEDRHQRLPTRPFLGQRPIAALRRPVDLQRQIGEIALPGVEAGGAQCRRQLRGDDARRRLAEMAVEPEPDGAFVHRGVIAKAHEAAGAGAFVDGFRQVEPARRIVGDEALDVPDQLAARPRVDQRAVVARRRRQRLPAETAIGHLRRNDRRVTPSIAPPQHERQAESDDTEHGQRPGAQALRRAAVRRCASSSSGRRVDRAGRGRCRRLAPSPSRRVGGAARSPRVRVAATPPRARRRAAAAPLR